jgi:hypothetical protein
MKGKFVFSVVIGLFVIALAGLAAADSLQDDRNRGMNYLERPTQLPGAEPETQSNLLPWQEREPVETGSIPAGSPELRCCDSSVDAEGNTAIRPEIDSGP